jgi:heat-inducible transcriptional repressor
MTDDRSLDERKAAILTAVVEEYIETAQPVGSGSIMAAAGIKVSSATVRNEMASLESDGYLTQPHTSAGRLPTEKAYRYFVDAVGQGTLNQPDRRQVSDVFRQMQGELEDMMQDTASLLSGLTDYAAVVVDQSTEAAVIRSIQLVSLAPRLALAVVVLSNGVVDKYSVELDHDTGDHEIDEARQLICATLEGDRQGVSARAPDSGDVVRDLLVQRVVDIVTAGGDPDRVYVDGASRVVGSFEAVESVKRVLTILEQQLVVVRVLTDVLDRGLNVAIGTETGVERLEDCSVVVAPYEIEGERAGSIAVLGPTRMHYPQTMAAVAAVSRKLSERLSEG